MYGSMMITLDLDHNEVAWPNRTFTFAGGFSTVWVERFLSIVDFISQLTCAFKAAWNVCALSSISTQAGDPALVNVCSNHDCDVSLTTTKCALWCSKVQVKLTLAVGSIIRDEDGHIVRRAVTSQASAVVAAVRVVAGGARPTDFVGSYLTFIFIYKIITMLTAYI